MNQSPSYRIGLLSDSHGRADTTRRAVKLLLAHGADCLIHLGDVGSEQVLDELVVARPGAPGDTAALVEAHVVFGNCDYDEATLTRYAQGLGLVVDHPLGKLALADSHGGHLYFCHGHRGADMQAALGAQPRYVCHGHTHLMTDQRRGPTRIINPGALHRAARHTVALLEPEHDELTFLNVPGH